MSESREPYVLGTGDDELDRLGLQHRIWSEVAHEGWRRAGFGEGMRILDVGCGPGYASEDLAAVVGLSGEVVAVDESENFIRALEARRLPNVRAVLADVQEYEPSPDSFDGAYARWVLCFLSDPGRAITRVSASLKSGGMFVVQDYFNYRALSVFPRPRVQAEVISAVERAWRDRGGDPDFALRLPAMMKENGLEIVSIRPILRLASFGDELWSWPLTFFSNFLPVLVNSGYLGRQVADEYLKAMLEASRSERGFFSTPTVYEIIGRRR
ncbi:MAG: methyltransferase domain-containing protein [Armatimonadetes bacterium]|nr:methyltransferase domain-containing protein [Armatimonadota bacterium]NOG93856.1 methyltransferase domain-containing protein [Armatimonadota bacterium]